MISLAQLFDNPRVEPGDPHRGAAIADNGFHDHLLPAFQRTRSDALHRTNHRHHFIIAQPVDGQQAGVIIVAAWEVIEHIPQCLDPQAAESLGVARAYA